MSSARPSYRELLTRELSLWAAISLAGRAPVAMAPLALVFLARQSPGGYTLGASLASAYVLGEVVGAPLLGTRLSGGRQRLQLSAGLMAGALAFGALPLAHTAPSPVLLALAFLAGAAPAACPGGLRAMLTRLVNEDLVSRALSAEATLTQCVWAAAPGLVVILALQVYPGAPLVLGAVLMATASLLLLRLEEPEAAQPAASAERSSAPMTRTLLSGWPVYLTSAAAMAMLATAELVLPALLEDRHIAVGWSGLLLAGFSLASAAGAFCYGLRTWPGSVRVQSLVFLAVTAGWVCLITLLPGLAGIAVALLPAGFFQSGVMVTRNLSLRERLPEHAHAAAYSVMYAVQGVGYSLTASLSAVALNLASPSAAILGGVGITLLITAVSAAAERPPKPTVTPGPPLSTGADQRG
ncbi:MFS transporter [Streptomyces thermodiastaticus]|uniref:MFS transporter n=1 Tax=Streptomyces thermodiastaticus TaxID=44061 RepID=UPI00167717D0|nr:MFS transporter [Streptomyces thermodiastaticus]MCE7550317.1 MFS transporter [Streptomyces thermodiastaticus]GHF90903.1 ABC transporter permease [Streptomyces thermodiastaticus]